MPCQTDPPPTRRSPLAFTVVLVALAVGPGRAVQGDAGDRLRPVTRRVTDLVAAMTQDEKLDLVSSGLAGVPRNGVLEMIIDLRPLGSRAIRRVRPPVRQADAQTSA